MGLFSRKEKEIRVLAVIKGGVKTTKESQEFIKKNKDMEIKNNGK
jgi:hypothetical protein